MLASRLQETDWHPTLAALHAYWHSIAPSGRLPGRQHFDPAEVPRLLPHLWLIDVEPDPRRFRWRLIGTEAQGGKLRLRPGDLLEDHLDSAELARARAVLEAVLESPAPSWARGRPVMPHAPSVISLERLILPLARDGTTVDMLLGATVYHWDETRR